MKIGFTIMQINTLRNIVAYCCTFMLICGCSFLQETVWWDFDDEFSGLIKVVETDNGKPLEKIDGQYRIFVPYTGLVNVRSIALFNKSHKVIVSDPPGFGPRSPDGKGFYYLLSPPKSVVWGLVGTEDEYAFYMKNPDIIESHFEKQLTERQGK